MEVSDMKFHKDLFHGSLTAAYVHTYILLHIPCMQETMNNKKKNKNKKATNIRLLKSTQSYKSNTYLLLNYIFDGS
jgi:hypothetical protein